MKHKVYDRLLSRELGQDSRKRYSNVRGIYGDRKWVEDMDIVNELEGHNGCVNALSWSTSGRLLASGSDDHRINIHSYHPESSSSQFNLTTSIMTGHSSNIFSVKFMPYSNDRTIVSATDDVRIFDIEHSGHSIYGSSSASRRPQGIRSVRDGLTLTEGDTNAKAFRSHGDTVKRIVTEDNPFYFLTCSEDGDVRQWDIRQPASTYPPRKDGMMPRWANPANASDSAPAPLISYSRYNLDLNTVSCSPSQPHYIALGGAHLHCFLHDRRMLGRDRLKERGAKLSGSGNWNGQDDLSLGQATQCVKKFAPNGQQRMGRTDNGHITACKISDANPNELVVSWSGDWIYSFDILRSPDASEELPSAAASEAGPSNRVRDKVRKRKRTKSAILSQESAERAGSRQRTESSPSSLSDAPEGLALRVNYGNGQSEEIRIASPRDRPSEDQVAALRSTDHYRIARSTVMIRKYMFGSTSGGLTSVMGFAASTLPDMDRIARTWRYPIDPDPIDVALQNTLRDGRAASRRFVQAAATLARVLGGQLRTGGDGSAFIGQYCYSIQPAPNERPLPRHEQFGYDFLKAILLWLDSGLGAVVEGFSSSGSNRRLPLGFDTDRDPIDDVLIPYLLHLAGDGPIVNVAASKYETDDTRILYTSEKAAVIAFARALKVPFADLTGTTVSGSGTSSPPFSAQDRETARDNWALQVGRGVLLNAAKDIRFASVDRAFGGSGISDTSIEVEEQALRRQQEDVNPLEDEDFAGDVELLRGASAYQRLEVPPGLNTSGASRGSGIDTASELSTSTMPIEHTMEEPEAEEDDDDVDDNEEGSDGDIDPMDESEPDEDGVSGSGDGRFLWRSDFDRSYWRERVNSHVPCSPHTRAYSGHCNVRTVKDVNFFGLQDEYVVSGSDSGHVFIWDKKTSQLLNILEGDGEVVNVVQGHPYEPTMAVSGIDHTIKIFSPDKQEQRNARRGIGVQSADPGQSSLSFGRRRRTRPTGGFNRSSEPVLSRDESQEPLDDSDDDDERVAPNGLSSRKRMDQEYEITSQNDMDRKGGREDAYITRALLAQLAQRIQAHNGPGGDLGTGEGPIIIDNDDERCRVM